MLRLRLTGSNARIFTSSMLAVGLLVLCSLPLAAQDDASSQPTVSQAVRFAVSPPLRELAKLPRPPQYGFHEALPVRRIAKRDFGVAVDPVEQSTVSGAPVVHYSIGLDFLGVGNGFPGYTVPDAPPDTNMAVGDSQIVQWVNVSFAVFDKYNGAILAGPIAGNLLFGGLGGACANYNDGDPIAQWDNSAHRWLLAQNVFHGPPYYACVAVSTSADALGTYYLYQFPLGNYFPDYPKWGRWTNSWGQSMNNFGPGGFVGPGVCAYERSRLLAGSPFPRQVCFQLSPDGDSLLPADIDSPTNPPAGECQFFIGSVADFDNSHLSLYDLCIDWLRPSQAKLHGDHNTQLTLVPPYTGSCGGGFGGACVPQKGIPDQLDSLGDRLMYRFAYYNDGTGGHQHWYVNHDVHVGPPPPSNQIGVRWYEFQAPQFAITPPYLAPGPFQAGTYAPDPNYRWMGSMAGDRNNDILVGYSESSSTMYPSIEVAGRLPSGALGTLESELSVVAGTGSQPDTANRWGDYSAMRIDPDGCTFWYTTEYYMVTQRFDWSTQIANIKFAGCHNPAYDGYIELCKQTDPDFPVSGTFNFNLTAPFFSTGPIGVPVGACSPPIRVPSGEVTVTEAPQIGVAVENVTAYSYDQFGNYVDELLSWTPPDLTATVNVVRGGVNLETVATFTNYAAPPGTLKVCKIAGPGITVGTLFTFTATGLPPFTVPAGPPPGGSCEIVGTFPVNTPVTVAEVVPPGVSVSNITVNPPARGGTKTSNSVIVTIGSGVTEVDFTDIKVPLGSCQGSSSLSVLLVNGTNVVAYVPKGNWGSSAHNIGVTNIEGNSIPGSGHFLINTPNDVINSCASDPTLTETVCTANTANVYLINGVNAPTVTVMPSGGVGTISFSGGSCTNCGVAMDAVRHKAVIGLSDNGRPAFQFLSLIPSTFGLISDSPTGQISEDPLIDPVSTPPLLLSATENGNYQIADISDTDHPLFYENFIGNGGVPSGEPDSSGADCSTGIALAPIEFSFDPSVVYLADLTQAIFSSGLWTDTASLFQPLSGSRLSAGASGNAVAQGTHIGVVTGEFGGNALTAIQLPPAPGGSPAITAWLTCSIFGFSNGFDPHTVTAYQGLGGTLPGGGSFPAGDAIAVLANSNASMLAVIDLTRMLGLSQTVTPHVCDATFLPPTVVKIIGPI